MIKKIKVSIPPPQKRMWAILPLLAYDNYSPTRKYIYIGFMNKGITLEFFL